MTAPTTSPPQRATPGVLRWASEAGRALALPVGSVLFAFLVGGVIVAVTGGNPLAAYQALGCGGLGLLCSNGENPVYQISTMIVFTTPLILTGLSVALAFRSGLFNIGAEGQLIMGAIACTVVGVRFASAPAWVLLPAVLIAGTAAGALWGGLVGVLKAVTGAHEVVTTIMLNYVAQWFLRYLIIGGPMQLPHGYSTSSPIGPGAFLPTLLPQSGPPFFGLPATVFRAHYGLFVSLAAAAFYAFLLARTALGYEIRAVGQSHRAARYAGVSVKRTIIVSMLIAGAFAGLAGAVQVAGIDHNLTDKYFTDTTGFDAIAVALLGQGAALGIVVSAFLFGALHAGGSVMQADAGVSGNLVFVLQALILFSIAANFLRTIKFRLPGLGRAPDSPADTTTAAGPAGEEPNPALVDSQNTA
jgi:general nucleoside transport system permease protein